MNYIGKLFGQVGNKYFDTGKTTEDWDALENKGRFIRPTGEQLVEVAILFNRGIVDKERLVDMVGMCEFIIDRLHENGDMKIPTSLELLEDKK